MDVGQLYISPTQSYRYILRINKLSTRTVLDGIHIEFKINPLWGGSMVSFTPPDYQHWKQVTDASQLKTIVASLFWGKVANAEKVQDYFAGARGQEVLSRIPEQGTTHGFAIVHAMLYAGDALGDFIDGLMHTPLSTAALHFFRSAVEKNQRYQLSYVYMGDVLFRQRQYGESVKAYNSAAKIYITEPYFGFLAANNLGCAEFGLGRENLQEKRFSEAQRNFASARLRFQDALDLYPNDCEVRSNLLMAALHEIKSSTEEAGLFSESLPKLEALYSAICRKCCRYSEDEGVFA